MAQHYDLVVVGGGPGGYVAAAHAAKKGLKVAVVEKEKIGGICLHKGCIPSKSFLKSAEMYHAMKESTSYGITTEQVRLDMQLVQKRKEDIIAKLYQGVNNLLRGNKVDVYHGTGRLMGPSIFSPLAGGTIAVEKQEGEAEMLVPKFVLLATGSRPRHLRGLEVDHTHILTSDDALELQDLPASMLIVGGGAIGVEWASMLSDMGVQVVLVEYADRILPQEDEDISMEMKRILEGRNVTIWTNSRVDGDSVQTDDGQVTLNVIQNDADTVHTITINQVLVSVGRDANTEDLGLDNTNIQVEGGVIPINGSYQTAESHIYAIGDVIGGYQLAHVASREGILAVNHMLGENIDLLNPNQVPRCTYSRPEVASIGLTEQVAREQGYDVVINKYPLRYLGKPLVYGNADGFIKIIGDEKTQDLLGVHLIGVQATELISTASLAKFLDASPWEIGQVIFPHPTFSEVFGEATQSI
ncbi:dihydrolipoyl dehydrogenase [Shimazuella kribbensis]|uniref:dihydrolipoyl dehydrogenase n=1 Tax=Shimazuella kribbensis TaxID=139808 RepID=UPI000400D6A0|nr:dihydrolipoyl dehydrogenase [Shimazuella kribbensis]